MLIYLFTTISITVKQTAILRLMMRVFPPYLYVNLKSKYYQEAIDEPILRTTGIGRKIFIEFCHGIL